MGSGAGGPEHRGKVCEKQGHSGELCVHGHHEQEEGTAHQLTHGHERLRTQTPSAHGLGRLETWLRRYCTVRSSAGWPGEHRDTVFLEGSKHRAAAPQWATSA